MYVRMVILLDHGPYERDKQGLLRNSSKKNTGVCLEMGHTLPEIVKPPLIFDQVRRCGSTTDGFNPVHPWVFFVVDFHVIDWSTVVATSDCSDRELDSSSNSNTSQSSLERRRKNVLGNLMEA